MRIAILGAGQLGVYLTQRLSLDHQVSVIDLDEEKLGFISSAFDVQTIIGDVTKPNIMMEANFKDTDMIIAVTSNDTTNIAVCDMAYKLYKTPYKIARIRDTEYNRFPKLLNNIDLVIKSFFETTKRLEQLIFLSGAYFISSFFDKRVQIVGVEVSSDSPLVGLAVKDIYLGLGDIKVDIISVYRGNEKLDIDDINVLVKPGDRVMYLSEKAYSSQILSIFQPKKTNIRKIFIAGINYASITLAKSLESKGYIIKMIDPSAEKCEFALSELSKSTILHYNPVNNNLLVAEGIDEADMFFALTNSDEINIMSSILAKKLGAKKTVATVNSSEYYDITRDLKLIDISISPHNFSYTTIKAFLTQVDMLRMYEIEDSEEMLVELKVHGQENMSTVIGKKINDLKLPQGLEIIAIMKIDNIPRFYADSFLIQDQDRLIIKVDNKNALQTLEKLFQVMPLYIA
ncbi:Trk system potassium transporter TrkA [Francisella tularensis]|uniref:Trk system potassium uptake protein TrkA n=11 Tax=Francisella tularensis TaxID=263 RepID=Q5NG84_FRATT|nr:Trk system potassium transporter TrkA [Francisella tularensis]AFX70886.1 potassium transporter peripheral membrane component [Francisella tularensis subsp. holarctica F92]AHH46612.1 potassium transporter TrkA [Francisella tularensis subsp. holarctica PHIT-FT049]ABI83068.1 probable Trk family potassium (K+) transporter, NAD+ binding protein [Francisella tularensis subsp. holarctica OSU18]ABK89737.1 Trk system potassium uptake protein TrkA [Francisella tularensis subsp. novicida U112]ABO46724